MKINCKICGGDSIEIFGASILNKYQAAYFQCRVCDFIQTEEPFWLEEAYTSAITAIDVGLIYRNHLFAGSLPALLNQFAHGTDSFLDYGGGYGMFVRMMRDNGFDFYLYDKYADNLFAKYFSLNDYTKPVKFKAVTAFEVFEHLPNPLEEISKMFAFSDTLIFSTELQPNHSFKESNDWWYFSPEHGQHVAFYGRKTLDQLALHFKCQVYSNGFNLHILSKLSLAPNPFVAHKTLFQKVVKKIIQRTAEVTGVSEKKQTRSSLLAQDFALYRERLLNPVVNQEC